jgi:hypothetical protein
MTAISRASERSAQFFRVQPIAQSRRPWCSQLDLRDQRDQQRDLEPV